MSAEQPWTPAGATLRPSERHQDRWIVLFARRAGPGLEFAKRVLSDDDLQDLGAAPRPSPIGASYQLDGDTATWRVLRASYREAGWQFGETEHAHGELPLMRQATRGRVAGGAADVE